jgi:hypothetical protein
LFGLIYCVFVTFIMRTGGAWRPFGSTRKGRTNCRSA